MQTGVLPRAKGRRRGEQAAAAPLLPTATENPITRGIEARFPRRLPAQSPRPVRCSGAVWASWLGPLAPRRRCCWAQTLQGDDALTPDQREQGRRALLAPKLSSLS